MAAWLLQSLHGHIGHMEGRSESYHHLLSDRAEPDPGQVRRVERRCLVNILNFLNFQNRSLLVVLTHTTYGSTRTVPVVPMPCRGNRLECHWQNLADPEAFLGRYRFANILLADGRTFLLEDPDELVLDGRGISFLLPETCREAEARKVQRHSVVGVEARIVQDGAEFRGELKDFSSLAFRVQTTAEPPQTFDWIDSTATVHLNLRRNGMTLYAGECRIIRQSVVGASGTFVLEPYRNKLRRFQPRVHRAVRQKLTPPPNLLIIHPLTGTEVTLRIADLSGSGMAVEETAAHSLLMPGLIIPKAVIAFAGWGYIRCRAQVVYRNAGGGADPNGVLCGLAIIDIAERDQLRLMALLQQAADANLQVNPRLDMEALWRFFFETGFIYPDKYAAMEPDKEAMKRNYARLYNNNPGIARHFVYRERGKILGHMAMLRSYDKAWLIHHHAAGRGETTRAGLHVLNQIGRYVNDIHHLPIAHLDYVFCYFRPENRFPDRVFGQFARTLDDPRGCSLDTFTYFHFSPRGKEMPELPVGWGLVPTGPDDLDEAGEFYRHVSGGLMIRAFDLEGDGADAGRLSEEYRALGFVKERHLLSLKRGKRLAALFMANVTDIGLNMSNLTCSTTALILDRDIPAQVLERSLAVIARRYERGGMPVLLYPPDGAGPAPVGSKTYYLWVLNLKYLDQYFAFCDEMLHQKG